MSVDGRAHHEVLSTIVHRGHPPRLEELARALAISRDEAAASLRRLHDGHGLVLHPGSTDVWIAHPFSASPAAVWVAAGTRGWWAPCLWCAMGIVALAAPSATIHARYAGEHEPAALDVRG
ncbi:MAG TPA: organomercurial lyase, partial [Kofleriaceae bacterium]|nr:organomercurial lyase [Kofleriaceae bacterium]